MSNLAFQHALYEKLIQFCSGFVLAVFHSS